MGTLFNAGLGKTQQEQNSTSLVLDMGGGTFDWYVSKGMQPMPQRCGAVNVGMLTCCAELCDRIKPNLRNNREIMSRVDHALRSNALTVRVTGEEIDLEKYQPQVADVLNRAFGPMLKKVGDLDDVDFILLTGGGANLLAKMAAAKLQQYTKLIRLDEEPVFSNVRGFHLAAEHLIATAQ